MINIGCHYYKMYKMSMKSLNINNTINEHKYQIILMIFKCIINFYFKTFYKYF
jgi:hypothetical protein